MPAIGRTTPEPLSCRFGRVVIVSSACVLLLRANREDILDKEGLSGTVPLRRTLLHLAFGGRPRVLTFTLPKHSAMVARASAEADVRSTKARNAGKCKLHLTVRSCVKVEAELSESVM